jgi:hypothetical protein
VRLPLLVYLATPGIVRRDKFTGIRDDKTGIRLAAPTQTHFLGANEKRENIASNCETYVGLA